MERRSLIGIAGVLLIAISLGLMVSHYIQQLPTATTPTPTPTPPSYPPYQPTPTPTPTPPPASGTLEYVKTVFDSPEGSGSHIWVKYGDPVKVYVTLHAVGGPVSGELKVEVREDIVFNLGGWADKTYKVFTKYITLNAGEFKTIYVGSFVAKNVTGEDNFREYFVKVWFNGENIYDPKDPNTREWVKVYLPSTTPPSSPTPTPYPPTLGQIKYIGTYFQADQGHT